MAEKKWHTNEKMSEQKNKQMRIERIHSTIIQVLLCDIINIRSTLISNTLSILDPA